MKVTDIIWNTDGDTTPDLPTTVEVPDNLDVYQVSDYLSDKYEWLVDSFSMPDVDYDCTNGVEDEYPDDDNNDDDDTITRDDVIDLFAESGWNLFGKNVDRVAEAIADEVVKEYNEAGDGNLQKAISYVILDKFDQLC